MILPEFSVPLLLGNPHFRYFLVGLRGTTPSSAISRATSLQVRHKHQLSQGSGGVKVTYESMAKQRLVIIDGYSLLYRAFFATRFLSTSDGRPTNALYSFTNMLFYLLENVRPNAIVVAFDAPGKTFRHAEYAEYKGTRRETPPELTAQFPVARDLMAALGVPTIELTGYEADDVVGTISRKAAEAGYDSTIVTGDLDSLQLVDENVSVLTSKVGVTDTVTYTPEKVQERYGFGPELVPDYKAIVGDTSDNIPGVPGIGEKGATTLIQAFGPIETILERFAEVDPKFQKKIEPVIEQMKQSKWLATIDCNAPIEYDFKPFVLSENQMAAAKAMMEQLEFKSQVRRADGVLGRYVEGRQDEEPIEVKTESLNAQTSDLKSLDALKGWVAGRPYAIHFQISEAQTSMFDEPTQEAFVAIGNQVRRVSQKDGEALLRANPALAAIHDAKPTFKRLELFVPAGFDTSLAGFVLQPGRSVYGLRELLQGYLEVTPANAADLAAGIGFLREEMGAKLAKESQTSVLTEIEQPLTPVLASLETAGISANPGFFREFSKSLQVDIDRLQSHVWELAGQEFNIGSPKQLGEVLFEKLEIPGPKKTKTGYATGAEVLQSLALMHPICSEVLSWRELSKLKSTYADALPRMIRSDGRIHTTYNQTGAATGRISSNDPNLQNIPTRTELGRQIRRAFVAAPGFELLSLDYSQIELRVLAHMSQDEALVHAFSEGEDVHTITAALMYNMPSGDVTREMRGYSKLLNYAVLYGVTDFGLANQLGGNFSVGEAKALIEQYNTRFPRIKGFTDAIVAEARSKGFTTTLCGRRRYFPDIHAANRNERMYAERQAMNAPIQGTAADMIKLAMIKVQPMLEGKRTRMLLTVHDELVFELDPAERDLIEPIRHVMETALPLDVPVEVDAKVGANWSEMTPIPRQPVS